MRGIAVACSSLLLFGCGPSGPSSLRIAATWPLPAHELPYAGAQPATEGVQVDL